MTITCYRRRKPGGYGAKYAPGNYVSVQCSGYGFKRVKETHNFKRVNPETGRYEDVPTEVEMHPHSSQMIRLLGLDPKRHLPAEGLPAREVPGYGPAGDLPIRVWVDSTETARAKKQFQRVRAECPGCHKDVPAGRLFSHRCKTGQ